LPSEFELGAEELAAPSPDVTAAIGTDERRMHVQADDRSEQARARLRAAAALSLGDLGEAEFCLVVTRRTADGRHEPVALVFDEALLDRAIRKAA